MTFSGDIVTKEEFAHEEALARAIVSALGDLITARTDDLPHRFKAPRAFAEYIADWGTNSTYQHIVPAFGSNHSNPMVIQMTTRPTQQILEIVFQGGDGMRLFTLEIEYDGNSNVPKL